MIYVSSLISTLLIESDKVVPAQEKYNMATFMVFVVLITLEIMVIQVVAFLVQEQEEDSHSPMSMAAEFMEREDFIVEFP